MNKQFLMCLTFVIGMTGAYTGSVSAESSISEVKALSIQVPLNQSRLLRLKGNVTKISQSNPQIADYDVFPGQREILIRGKALGTTNINVWYGKNTDVIDVEVTHDLEILKSKLHDLLPGENIEVRSAQQNIVLSGQVSGLDKMQAALDISQGFLPITRGAGGQGSQGGGQAGSAGTGAGGSGQQSRSQQQGPNVINMLSVSGAHQVMLEVKVAEIDRRIAKGLNVQFNALRPSSEISFGALSGGGTLGPFFGPGGGSSNILGPIGSILFPNQHSVDAAGLFLSAMSGDFMFNLTIDAAKDQDLAKILAEPTLTTLSGQEAKFISGGEFPIPVPQGQAGGAGTITIRFKEFGISLRFLPVVLDTGRINLNMNVSVSELSRDAAIVTDVPGSALSFSIPSLTKREASSTLELADGQTMSIAGLISDTVRENVNKFPGLGDVPVLGALFRNERFVKNQTELVIFVTPKLAKPVLAKDIMLPTDHFVEPDDMDFYIFGKLEARDAEQRLKRNSYQPSGGESGGLDGHFGHQLIEEM